MRAKVNYSVGVENNTEKSDAAFLEEQLEEVFTSENVKSVRRDHGGMTNRGYLVSLIVEGEDEYSEKTPHHLSEDYKHLEEKPVVEIINDYIDGVTVYGTTYGA